MRPIWKGAISFGLVNIPVRLFVAARSQATGFRQLHRRCHTPIQYRKWCPHCDQELELDEITRGVEVGPGQFVIISDEELESLPLPTAKTIKILDFVDHRQIDPIYYDRSFYLAPAEGAERPYGLLYEAMRNSGRTAIAKVLLRTRESLATVRAADNILILHTMFYAQDVRSPQELVLPEVADVDQRELSMAATLIDNLTASFAPDRYQSDYREALERLVEAKIEGEQVAVSEPERPKVIDLMEALTESVRQAQDERMRQAR